MQERFQAEVSCTWKQLKKVRERLYSVSVAWKRRKEFVGEVGTDDEIRKTGYK